ncbi:MAG: hypothetical protein A3K22_02650 [Deltaproteobacteria bacterium RBG_16_42_7]|nr:MAG: hypothetical protein A3K22_02650 [Deltaproteobacteria bacterium RBG_16_42_7]
MKEKEQFIWGLEKEHAGIVKIFSSLEQILKKGEIDDAADTLKTISKLKDILINHLNNEDKIFYSDMRKKAIELSQDALLHALDIFIDDMNKISKKVFEFFSKYENDISGREKEFIQDLAEVKDVLIKRINSEEKTLYHIYKAYYNI